MEHTIRGFLLYGTVETFIQLLFLEATWAERMLVGCLARKLQVKFGTKHFS